MHLFYMRMSLWHRTGFLAPSFVSVFRVNSDTFVTSTTVNTTSRIPKMETTVSMVIITSSRSDLVYVSSAMMVSPPSPSSTSAPVPVEHAVEIVPFTRAHASTYFFNGKPWAVHAAITSVLCDLTGPFIDAKPTR